MASRMRPATVKVGFLWMLTFISSPPLTLSASRSLDMARKGLPSLTSEGVRPWNSLDAAANESGEPKPWRSATSMTRLPDERRSNAASASLRPQMYSDSVIPVKMERTLLNIAREYPDRRRISLSSALSPKLASMWSTVRLKSSMMSISHLLDKDCTRVGLRCPEPFRTNRRGVEVISRAMGSISITLPRSSLETPLRIQFLLEPAGP